MENENIVVTEEILEANPELAEAGVQLGSVGVAVSEEELANLIEKGEYVPPLSELVVEEVTPEETV